MSYSKDFFQQIRDSRKFIFPILLTILLTAILTIIVKAAYFPNPEDKPQNIAPINGTNDIINDPVGAAATGLTNALIYVFIALIGGFILVFLIRTGKIKILELLFASMMGFATFVFGIYVLTAIPYLFFVNFPTIVPFEVAVFVLNEGMLVISVFFGAISFLVLGLNRFRSQKLHNTLMILFGSLMGVVFGINFETVSLFFVLLALAVYDIYAVFWCPIKQMFRISDENDDDETIFENKEKILVQPKESMTLEEEKKDSIGSPKKIFLNTNQQNRSPKTQEYYEMNQNLPISLPVYFTPEISIGLGDFVFFSVLISKSFYEGIVNANYWLFFLPFIGILIGSFLTFRLLEKRDILPALPLPIITGTFGFILAIFLHYLPQIMLN